MARPPGPRGLAVGFGGLLAVISIVAWLFAQTQSFAWFPAELTRWIYTTYLLVAAVFLVGMGGLGLSVRGFFTRLIRDIDTRLGAAPPEYHEALPPPLPEATVRDTVDRDIDELLESLSEVEATATREVQAMDRGVQVQATYQVDESVLSERRERLVQRRKFLPRYLVGPSVVAAIILGISGIMLPGSDYFAQNSFHLNTALILGIAYNWLSVGGYVAASVYALLAGREEGRRR